MKIFPIVYIFVYNLMQIYDIIYVESDIMKDAKYIQVVNYIKEKIERGHLSNGDRIETEEELCKRFSYSRMTVNKALSLLAESGYIIRTPGKGSFVKGPRVRKNTESATSFSSDMERIGLKAGSKLLIYEVKKASDIPEIQKRLKLTDDDLIHYFIRLRTGNDMPVAFSCTYISAKIVPAIDVSCLNSSFYSYLDSIGIQRLTTELELKAVMPSAQEKEWLKIENAALLCSSHITYTRTKAEEPLVPFEYVQTYYNGEMYSYTVTTGELLNSISDTTI